jgi:ribA/ribD-fused uncharacterized protein
MMNLIEEEYNDLNELEPDDYLEEIYFYSHFGGKFKVFSNFYQCMFYDYESHKIFKSTEQYFMYHKCKLFNASEETLDKIMVSTPSACKKIGRTKIKNYDDDLWRKHRKKIMKKGVNLKFTQDPELLAVLLSTQDKNIYEASNNDDIWGIGYDIKTIMNGQIDKENYGHNYLGKILMETRNELRYSGVHD